MKIKGIKRGNTIELLEIISNIPDGTEIEIEITNLPTTQPSHWQSLEQVLGSWENDCEIANIFAEIDKERHSSFY